MAEKTRPGESGDQAAEARLLLPGATHVFRSDKHDSRGTHTTANQPVARPPQSDQSLSSYNGGRLLLAIGFLLALVTLAVQASWYQEGGSGDRGTSGTAKTPAYVAKSYHAENKKTAMRTNVAAKSLRAADADQAAVEPPPDPLRKVDVKGLPGSLVRALRDIVSAQETRLNRYFDGLRSSQLRQLKRAGVLAADVGHMMRDLQSQESRRRAKLDQEAGEVAQTLRGQLRQVGRAETLDEEEWKDILGSHEQATEQGPQAGQSDATAGSSTAENHERTLQSPPHETQSNHLRQQSRKVPKRTTVRMDKQVFKKDTVLRARKIPSAPASAPQQAPRRQRMAAARSPPVNYGFAPEQAKRFREFEAKHMATLYPAQLSLHKTESTMTDEAGDSSNPETAALPRDLREAMAAATREERALLVTRLRSERRAKLVKLLGQGVDEQTVLNRAVKLWQEEEEALASFAAEKSRQHVQAAVELHSGGIGWRFCQHKADSLLRLQASYDRETQRHRQAISSRRSLERELEVSSLIAEAWGPQDIAAKDQALRRAEEQGLEQLERHLASRRAEAVPRMRAEVDDMCRAMAGHRAHARH